MTRTRGNRHAPNVPVPSAAAAFLLSPDFTVDGHGRVRPPVALDDLGAVLTRVSGAYAGAGLPEGVLLLTDAAAGALAVPTDRPDPATPPPLPGQGWTTRKLSDWMTYTATGRPAVHLGILPLIQRRQCSHCACEHPECPRRHTAGACRCPLLSDFLPDIPASLARWHALTGRAWHHSSGVAVTSMFRATMPEGPKRPIVKPKREGPDRRAAQENALTWVNPDNGSGQWRHKFDANRAYVGAAGVVHVAPGILYHTGKREFHPLIPGWWQIQVPAWNDPRLPHPAGYRPRRRGDDDRIRWVTTPTMVLLAELAEQGRIAMPEVLDSWTGRVLDPDTGQGGRRLFQKVAHTLGQAYAAGPDPITDPADVDRVRVALKAGGRAVFGMFADTDNWIFRPDWWYSIVAMARANLWRKIDRAATAGGVFPVRVDTDAVYYQSDVSDAAELATVLQFKIDDSGMALGAFSTTTERIAA